MMEMRKDENTNIEKSLILEISWLLKGASQILTDMGWIIRVSCLLSQLILVNWYEGRIQSAGFTCNPS